MSDDSNYENDVTMNKNASAASADADTLGEVRSTWAVSGFTMISRVLGFARLIILVWLFGSMRWASDAFIFAFRIPNLFRNVLGEGALSAAFIPNFVRTDKTEGRASAARLGSQALTALAAVGAAISVVGILVCLIIDYFFVSSEQASLALRLTAILFPFMPLVCLAALLGAMLNSLRQFALPAALSIILNLGFLAGFAYVYWWQCGGDLARLDASASTYAVALFVLLAGAIEVLVQIPALFRQGVALRPDASFNHPGLKATLAAFAPTALGLGLVQINAFVDSLIAGGLSLSSPGAVTYLEIAVRFMQLPLGVFGVAIATVSFPGLAANAAAGDAAAVTARLFNAIRMSLFLILPASAVLIAMADPIIRLAYQRPDLNFDHAAVYRSSTALILYSAGLIFYSLRQILVRAYYARGEFSYPVKVAAVMVGVNLVLNLTLIFCPDLYRLSFPSYMRYWNLSPADFPGGFRLGETGLALATMLTAIADVTVLALGLRKRLAPELSKNAWADLFPPLRNTLARMLVASLAGGVLTWLYRNSIPYEPEFLSQFIRVGAPLVLACGTFYLLGVIIPLPEMKEFLFAALRRKKQR